MLAVFAQISLALEIANWSWQMKPNPGFCRQSVGGCAGVTVISIYRFVLELIVDRNELCSRLLTEPSVAVGGGQPPFSENVVGLYGHQNSGC